MAATITLDTGLQGKRVPFQSIPVIDLGPLRDGTDKQGVADAVGVACVEVGFFYIRNHGVSDAQMAEMFDLAQRFFALPEAAKMAIHVAKSPNHRGYFPVFEENTDPDLTADLKEGFDMMRHLGPDHPGVRAGTPLHGPNQYPGPDLPEFQGIVERYFQTMRGVAGTLLQAFALALGLPEDWFADKIDEPVAILRLLHYPPQQGFIREKTLGCGAHSDYGCMTILAQDHNGGLQLQNSADEWIDAPPIPGTFVVNIGDAMARWTNDLFAATQHRVINTSGAERYSIPFFFEPNYDTVIDCLPSCVTPDRPARFGAVTAGEYLWSRLSDTFTYIDGAAE